jgi:branched-chain amino acid transport system permease protein
MTQYVLAGLALGSIYAIASAGLVVTYVSAGVLNFAFGSMAYVVARFYFWLNSQHGWPTTTAGTVSILVVGPLLGAVLYLVLFRFIRGQSTLIKLVTTIGLSVALPPIADLLMGTQSITAAPGLALQSDSPIHFLGTPISTNQLLTYGFLLLVVVLGTVILRFTSVGLQVRAVVDSEAMASLSGTNPGRVALGAWMVSAMLAGIAGVLVAPTNGLTTIGMTTLMAAAFAAVVAAKLRSLVGAVVVSLAMGVLTDVITEYLPVNSAWSADILPSVPFAVMLVFLIVYAVRAQAAGEGDGMGGPLDRAITPATQTPTMLAGVVGTSSRRGALVNMAPFVVMALVPFIFSGSAFWLGVIATGLCFSITFLTFTVVTGEGGMLWLSQVVFAGAGALAMAQFATVWHLPVLVALLLGGVIAAAVGAVMGVLTIRLGQLYVALGTLTFGLLAETLIFDQERFLQGGVGVTVARPSFAKGDLAFCYLALAVFGVFALLIVNLRRSTSGMALTAVRDSESASRTLGLSVVQLKVVVGALGAFVAAVGGGFLALDAGVAQPASYETFAGLVWLAVVVTLGIRSILAAGIAGLAFSVLPAVFRAYVPARWLEVPSILFGLGAVMVARNPDGVVVDTGRQLRRLGARLARVRHGAKEARPAVANGVKAAAGDMRAAPPSLGRVGVEAGR